MSEVPRIDDLRIHRPAPAAVAARPLWPWVLVAALLAAAAAAYWWLGRPRPVPVTTALARAISATDGDRTVLNASGYVVARREATVSSKVMGKVTEVLVEEGVKVAAAQVLARLDATNLEASLRLAEAQARAAAAAIQETRVRLREAELELGRQTKLRKTASTRRATSTARRRPFWRCAPASPSRRPNSPWRSRTSRSGASRSTTRSSARRSPASSPRRTPSPAR
jgi:HlyD family secretion protein